MTFYFYLNSFEITQLCVKVINGLSSPLQFLVCEIPKIGTFDAEIGLSF
jgi:hypothetical protein